MFNIEKPYIVAYTALISLFLGYRSIWNEGVIDFLYKYRYSTFVLPELIDACFLIFIAVFSIGIFLIGVKTVPEFIQRFSSIVNGVNYKGHRLYQAANAEIAHIMEQGNKIPEKFHLPQHKAASVFSIRLNLKRFQNDPQFRYRFILITAIIGLNFALLYYQMNVAMKILISFLNLLLIALLSPKFFKKNLSSNPLGPKNVESITELPSAELFFKATIAKYQPRITIAAYRKKKNRNLTPLRLPKARQAHPKNFSSFTNVGLACFFISVIIFALIGYWVGKTDPHIVSVPFYHRFLTFSFIGGVCGAVSLFKNSPLLDAIFLSLVPVIGVFVAVLIWYANTNFFFLIESLFTHAIHFMLLGYFIAARKTVPPKEILIAGFIWGIYTIGLFYLIPDFKMIYIFNCSPTLLIVGISTLLMAILMKVYHIKKKIGGIKR